MLRASPRSASAAVQIPPQVLSRQCGTPRTSLRRTGDSPTALSYAACTSVVGMGVAAPPPTTRTINVSQGHPHIPLRGYSPAAPPPITGTRYATQGQQLFPLRSSGQDAPTPVSSCSLSPRNLLLQVAGSAVGAPGCSLSPRNTSSRASSFGMEAHGMISESQNLPGVSNAMTKASSASMSSLHMSPRSYTVCRQVSVSGSPVSSSLGHRSPRCTVYREASSPRLSHASASTASGSGDSDSVELTSNPSVDAEEPTASRELPITPANKQLSESTDMSRALKALVPFDVSASTCNRHSGSPRSRSNLASDAYPRSRSNSRGPQSPRAPSNTSGHVALCKSPRLSQSASTSALDVVTSNTRALVKRSPVCEAVVDMLESDCRKLKVEQCLVAHRKQVSWLKMALQQQINEYQNEWTALRKHQAEQDRARTVILQRQAEAEERTKKHIQARQAREDTVFQNNLELANERMVKVKHVQDREFAREQRLAREREKADNELAMRAQSEAWRRKEVRMEGIRLAEEQSLAHAAKAKLKSDKVDAYVGETQRIYQRRKATSEAVENSMASMKALISQQRTRSIINVEALTDHMLELVASMED